MKLFDRLRRSTDEGSGGGSPGGSADVAVEDEGVGEAERPQAGTVSPSSAEPPATAPPPHPPSDPGRYDPAHPCHAPVSGVDLVLFARITHSLRVAPAVERSSLLAGHGHTPETWSAVNTVWMARLGQMPYLCSTYDEATRRP